MKETVNETIICCSCKKKFKTPKENKEKKKEDTRSSLDKKEEDISTLDSDAQSDKSEHTDNAQSNKSEHTDNAQNQKINPKFIHKKFKCPYCRTLNIIVEEVSIDKNNKDKKDKNDNSDSDKKNPKVSVTIYETTASGPTLDYLREHGMPDWIKDN